MSFCVNLFNVLQRQCTRVVEYSIICFSVFYWFLLVFWILSVMGFVKMLSVRFHVIILLHRERTKCLLMGYCPPIVLLRDHELRRVCQQAPLSFIVDKGFFSLIGNADIGEQLVCELWLKKQCQYLEIRKWIKKTEYVVLNLSKLPFGAFVFTSSTNMTLKYVLAWVWVAYFTDHIKILNSMCANRITFGLLWAGSRSGHDGRPQLHESLMSFS